MRPAGPLETCGICKGDNSQSGPAFPGSGQKTWSKATRWSCDQLPKCCFFISRKKNASLHMSFPSPITISSLTSGFTSAGRDEKTQILFCLFFVRFCLFVLERDRAQAGEGRREREREREKVPSSLRAQYRAQHETQSNHSGIRTRVQIKSQTLDRLSHPGAPQTQVLI